jgi:isopenicillin N synthase-like dioxygenase
MAETLTSSHPPENKIYFHSGSTPTYRTVTNTNSLPTTIPTIDITHISSTDPSIRLSLAKELISACSIYGFFYLTGHNLSQTLQDSTFEVMKRFFVLDIEEKMDAHVQENPAIRGYEPQGETRLDPNTKAGLSPSCP